MNFTHQANPVLVKASKIVGIGINTTAPINAALEDGTNIILTEEMIARFLPDVGDYVVTQEDGYVYVNPKAVFERKYSPLPKDSV